MGKAAVQYRFGKTKRPEAVSQYQKSVPGPGMYDKDSEGKWEKLKEKLFVDEGPKEREPLQEYINRPPGQKSKI